MKGKHNTTANLKRMMYLNEKYEILNYPDQGGLLNKWSELVSKFRQVNKLLLSVYKSND